MSDFNFTADYSFNDGVLIAETTVKINDQEYYDEIPFFYDDGFLLESVTNTIDEVLTDEQEYQIQLTLNNLTAKVRDDIKMERVLASISLISHDHGELRFRWNFMDYSFACKHYDGEDKFYILQEQLSFTNNTELWTECEFLSWDDLVI